MKPWKTRPLTVSSNSSNVDSSGFVRRRSIVLRYFSGSRMRSSTESSRSTTVPSKLMPISRVRRDDRPVRELHVALGVREQDPVDRRVEHRAQHVREPLEVDVLLGELALLARERARHLVERVGELADLTRPALRHLDVEPTGGDLARSPQRSAGSAHDRSAQEIGDDRGKSRSRDDDSRSRPGRRRSAPTPRPAAWSRAAIALLALHERVDQRADRGRRAACLRRSRPSLAAASGRSSGFSGQRLPTYSARYERHCRSSSLVEGPGARRSSRADSAGRCPLSRLIRLEEAAGRAVIT